jgi:hypothetical protein
MYKGWDIHNKLYFLGFQQSRTESVDFDMDDKGKGWFAHAYDFFRGRYPKK